MNCQALTRQLNPTNVWVWIPCSGTPCPDSSALFCLDHQHCRRTIISTSERELYPDEGIVLFLPDEEKLNWLVKDLMTYTGISDTMMDILDFSHIVHQCRESIRIAEQMREQHLFQVMSEMMNGMTQREKETCVIENNFSKWVAIELQRRAKDRLIIGEDEKRLLSLPYCELSREDRERKGRLLASMKLLEIEKF